MSPLLAIYAPAVPAMCLLAQSNGVTWQQVVMALVTAMPPMVASILAYLEASKAADRAKAATITAGAAVAVGKDNQTQLVEVKHAVVENTDKTIKVADELKETKRYIDGMRSELVQEVRGRGLAEGKEQGRVAALQETKTAATDQPEPSGTAAVAAAAAAGATKATAAEMTRIATATEETAENTRTGIEKPRP